MNLCNSITDKSEKDFCALQVAILKKDASLCGTLEYADDCNFRVAVANQDVSYCKKLQIGQSSCRLWMGTGRNNAEDCKTLVTDPMEQNACLDLVAGHTLNADVCTGKVCIREIAVATKNIELCNKAGDEKTRCYSEVISKLSDEALCSKYLTEKRDVDQCYKTIGIQKADISICKKVIEPGVQFACVIETAIWKRDKGLCQSLDDQWHKDGCQNQYDQMLSYITNPGGSKTATKSPNSLSAGTSEIPAISNAEQDVFDIKTAMAGFRALAELVYDNNSNSYLSICSGGAINTVANEGLPAMVEKILTAQGVSKQSDAGIICLAKKDKYVLEITLKKPIPEKNINAICVDSTGFSGDDTIYKIDKANFSCGSRR